MRVFRSSPEARGHFGPCAVMIGNFDGVHCGHQKLIGEVLRLSREQNIKPAALTFDPHPARVLAPDRAPRLLSTLEQRCRWMEEAGLEEIMILPFDRALAALTPEQFVQQILVDTLQARAVVVGDNFHFGNKQAGNAQVLAELGRRYGFVAHALHAVEWRGLTISSSAIRGLIQVGAVAKAARLLGRFFAIEGEIVRGLGIGSKQTVPTLNLATPAEVLPAQGVYVSHTYDLDSYRQWPSITNIGNRPTFNGSDVSIESYLLEPIEGDPPHRIRLELTHRIREERRFESAQALKAQILRDVERAKVWHSRYLSIRGQRSTAAL